MKTIEKIPGYTKPSFGKRFKDDMRQNYSLYLMVIPVILFYLLFHYKPIYGTLIAFKQFKPSLGIMGSPWVGFDNFMEFFGSHYFVRLLRNTLTISISSLIFEFPSAIILALMINEVKSKLFTKAVQTITYLPHFISLVVVCGLLVDFLSSAGLINKLTAFFGAEPVSFLQKSKAFVPIYIISNIWQEMGWSSIIYIAAIVGIDAQLYEAARIDGAGRIRQTIHITLPGMLPTILTMLILRCGSIMSVGFEKIILLYNPLTMETADVIASYVYRAGLQEFKYGLSTAVGLFNSVINLILLLGANMLSQKLNETSLW